MDAIEALKTRRSVREYQDKPVPKAIIEDILDCGRLAPSARNGQPWEFVVVTSADTRKKLASLITNGQFLPQAPACIAVFCRADAGYYVEDGSAATVHMAVAAKAHGLGSCWIAGDKKAYADPVRHLLGAPAEYKLVCVLAIGYPAAVPTPEKRPAGSMVHWEKY